MTIASHTRKHAAKLHTKNRVQNAPNRDLDYSGPVAT